MVLALLVELAVAPRIVARDNLALINFVENVKYPMVASAKLGNVGQSGFAIGANFAIDATTELSARIGWLHISNAQTGEQNPGVDTLAFALGLQFAF